VENSGKAQDQNSQMQLTDFKRPAMALLQKRMRFESTRGKSARVGDGLRRVVLWPIQARQLAAAALSKLLFQKYSPNPEALPDHGLC
jgi:hypothetical protein